MIQIILAILMTIGVYATSGQITIVSDTKSASGEVVKFSDSGNKINYTMSSTGGTEESGWGIISN